MRRRRRRRRRKRKFHLLVSLPTIIISLATQENGQWARAWGILVVTTVPGAEPPARLVGLPKEEMVPEALPRRSRPPTRQLTSNNHPSHIRIASSHFTSSSPTTTTTNQGYLTFVHEGSASLLNNKGTPAVSRQRSFVSEHGHDADDERSTPSSSPQRSSFDAIMRPGNGDSDGGDVPEPAYPGEDTRPTSRKELLGFYAYSFAAEVFVVCGLGAFIPITLEDLARASSTAVLAHDHSQSCRPHGLDKRSMLFDATGSVLMRGDHDKTKGAQCVFQILGIEVNTASFAMYTFSLSVLIQALLVVTMSGAADHGRFRKSLMITFAVIGAVATMLFLVVTPSVYLLGSLWAIIGNVCFGASFVLLNSFLPLLVRWHPSVRRDSSMMQDSGDDEHEVRFIRLLSVPETCCCDPSSWIPLVYLDRCEIRRRLTTHLV